MSFHIGSAPVPKAAASAYPTDASQGSRARPEALCAVHSADTTPSPVDVRRLPAGAQPAAGGSGGGLHECGGAFRTWAPSG
ncbi:hypothetical protein ACFWXA_36125 [Streptomyces atroolivaceus]|uniref:hypothetical protein n=1 Tax=Streptomyces atroolivaceus TaxID=66869 RepID=UPI0020253659|nr:hypothetical protein [Streptomyces atroolivaceus]